MTKYIIGAVVGIGLTLGAVYVWAAWYFKDMWR